MNPLHLKNAKVRKERKRRAGMVRFEFTTGVFYDDCANFTLGQWQVCNRVALDRDKSVRVGDAFTFDPDLKRWFDAQLENPRKE